MTPYTKYANAVKHLAEERVRRQARRRAVCRARGDRWLRSLSPDSPTVRTRLAVFLFLIAAPLAAQRVTVSLDGEWRIEDSVEAHAMPATFGHTGPVPGLANLATPKFPDVDRFDSAGVVSNRVRKGKAPASAMPKGAGISRQERNYFWYQRRFQAPARKAVAVLKINKAQFGTTVWMNGEAAGEHLGCFTAGYFDVTKIIRWGEENTVTVRIGAHPGVLPWEIPAGDDFEKNLWTPGIYDSVSLLAMDNPVIESVQVAPRIASSEILVQTTIRNHGGPAEFALRHSVSAWTDGGLVSRSFPRAVKLEAGAVTTIVESIPIPRARLWSPEDPFLYQLETDTGGDAVTTRFGMREFRFDTATRRAYLNGKLYFLRGSNITLHRFFEDPDCGGLPWDEQWVRKLLAEIPKRMNWNMFRFCIGPVPDRWLEIADEAGLLIQNEYFIWTGHPNSSSLFRRTFDAGVLIREYTEWMRDNWNHPSVVIWDANNESYDPVFAREVIPAVRGLDLSNRPWENSYNLPVGPDDPVEDHPYLFSRNQRENQEDFRMEMLEGMNARGTAGHTPSAHAAILNEYGWLWLNRDGSPTELTDQVYAKLPGPDATAEERFRLNGYYLGGLTEFWRAHRQYAGVLHFVYLTSSYPGAYTSDHFRDVRALALDPYFADYVGEAFKPVGVYVNFWRPKMKGGEPREIHVMVVNDTPEPVHGTLRLSLDETGAGSLWSEEQPLEIAPLGQRTYLFEVNAPGKAARAELRALASYPGGTTLSRRTVQVE